VDDLVAHRSEQQADEASVTAGSDDDEVGILGSVEDGRHSEIVRERDDQVSRSFFAKRGREELLDPSSGVLLVEARVERATVELLEEAPR